MIITLDMLQSYEPTVINNKKYWKKHAKLYHAEITPYGLVEIVEVTDKVLFNTAA